MSSEFSVDGDESWQIKERAFSAFHHPRENEVSSEGMLLLQMRCRLVVWIVCLDPKTFYFEDVACIKISIETTC